MNSKFRVVSVGLIALTIATTSFQNNTKMVSAKTLNNSRVVVVKCFCNTMT